MGLPGLRRAPSAVGLLLLSLGLASCGGGGSESPPQAPPSPEERYPEAAAQDVDARALAAASDALGGNLYTRFLLVERNGVLVAEDYLNGMQPAAPLDVRSVTKTVTSILVGIALDQGLIDTTGETVGDFLYPVVPSLTRDKAAITIRQLLMMRSGLPWNELGTVEQDYFGWVSSPNPLQWILDQPFEHPPGEVWHYNTGASHIPSAILAEAAGMSTRDFAQAHLFGPLEEEVGPWARDPQGYHYGGHGVSLRGRTMIKLGRLFLDGGTYQGRLVVSESWVRESTAWLSETGDALPRASGYGYFWWMDRDARTGLEYKMAVGYGGQFIVVVPQRNAVLAAATAWSGVPDAGSNFTFVLTTLLDTILPGLG